MTQNYPIRPGIAPFCSVNSSDRKVEGHPQATAATDPAYAFRLQEKTEQNGAELGPPRGSDVGSIDFADERKHGAKRSSIGNRAP
jgi:hypothetical protein